MQTKTGKDTQTGEFYTQEHIQLIYRYVFRYVRNQQEAEDITSQIFLKAVHLLDIESSPQSQWAWVFRVTRSTMADYWRIHYRRGATLSMDTLMEEGWEGPATDEGETIPNSAAEDRVQEILQSLPARYREVLTNRFLLNLSIRETALRMNLTESNVKVIQFRALKRAAELDEIDNGCLSR